MSNFPNESGYIHIKGARQHNLKNISLSLPRNKLVVITGLSGSGKSSLAFDTIYAEGQRRYVESLSSYARMFLEQMEKPDLDHIEGLSPAIAIEQKTTHRNPRSTVGTVTEVYDYLRLLFARLGTAYCHKCGKKIESQTPQSIVDSIVGLGVGAKVQVLAPVIRQRKGTYQKVVDEIRQQGFTRIRIDGAFQGVDDELTLERYVKHDIDIVVDRIVVKDGVQTRLTDSVETALKLGKGLLRVWFELPGEAGREVLYSEHFACPECNVSFEEIEPRMFSFNNPHGACPACTGLGEVMEIDPELVVPDEDLSISDGAIRPWSLRRMLDGVYRRALEGVCRFYKQDLNKPWKSLPDKFKTIVLYGTGDVEIDFSFSDERRTMEFRRTFEGVIPNLERRYRETESNAARELIGQFMTSRPCSDCEGARLRPESRAIRIEDKSIIDVTTFSVAEALRFFNALKLTKTQQQIGERILKEIRERLGFLENVGLDYLTMDRQAGTLSGGESQRIRLATQIGSGLVGVLYVLDEPSIGLHQRDNKRLISTLERLRNLGNTVIVVEHDEETIRSADYIVDLGPGAGVHGGEVVVAGPPDEVVACEKSLTGRYLNGTLDVFCPTGRRKPRDESIIIRGAKHNNLKNVTAEFPLGVFICVTGVSGSGKSSLVNETLYPAAMRKLHLSLQHKPGKHDSIEGLEFIDKVIDVDQSAIGRTPRSNPATYTGLFTPIRDLMAMTATAKARGYKAGRFSFNVKGGRCENCEGNGMILIEMHFLPDVYVPCEVCGSARYNRDTLEVRFKGKNIAEILDMTVEEGCEFFRNIPSIFGKLNTLNDVGLGYIRLGQAATTLSGGEAQRVKLATELAKRQTGRTLYILDEPTTGLHAADVDKLLHVLHRLVDAGNTVVVIEHNLDVIRTADRIIDIGPEGGFRGGKIVAKGTPEQVAKVKDSHTGRFLKEHLKSSGKL